MDYNYSGEVADTRDAFLESEIEYLKLLSQNPAFIDIYESFKEESASKLSARLLNLTQMMENGEIKEEEERTVELEIMCCCLAIEDKTKRLVKTLTLTNSEGKTHTR